MFAKIMSLHTFIRDNYFRNDKIINNNDINCLVVSRSVSIKLTTFTQSQLFSLLDHIRKLQVDPNVHSKRHITRDIERAYGIIVEDWDIN